MTHRVAALAPLKTAGVEGHVRHPRPRPRRRAVRPGRGGANGIARALVEADPELRIRSSGRASSRATPARSSARRPGSTRRARRRSSRSASPRREALLRDGRRPRRRRPDLTVDLVERLGKAATLWSGRGRVFVGRDTRGSGPDLEEAFARGVVAGGGAVLAGVLPTPAVALLALDLGVVISASHNPPEYNGVKFFDADSGKLTDASEERSRRSSTRRSRAAGRSTASTSRRTATSSTFSNASAPTSPGSGSRSTARTAPTPRSRRRRSRTPGRRGDRGRRPHRTGRTSTTAAAPPISLLQGRCASAATLSGRLRRRRRPHARGRRGGEAVDGDQILAILALHLGVDVVAVTVMTNLGFHRLMEERGIRVLTAVGDRYVLEALRREGDPRRRAVGARDLPARPRHGRRPRGRPPPLRRVRGRPSPTRSP